MTAPITSADIETWARVELALQGKSIEQPAPFDWRAHRHLSDTAMALAYMVSALPPMRPRPRRQMLTIRSGNTGWHIFNHEGRLIAGIDLARPAANQE